MTIPVGRSRRARLTSHDLHRFPSDTLFDKIGRAVCRAESLPRKELYEVWEVARRIRRRWRGGRVVDLACGHALLAHVLVLMDATSESALAIDARIPDNAAPIARALIEAWPRLEGRITVQEQSIAEVRLEPDDLVVSVHACGALTDKVLDCAIAARCRVAVLPCCHDLAHCDDGGLVGWLDAPMAIDVTRAGRLRAHGFAVRTQHIPEAITPKNRLLMAEPSDRQAPAHTHDP